MSFVSFLQEKKSFPSFLFRRKNGQLAREAQALRRTDAGTSCVVVGRNTTAGMPPSSALSLPVSAAPARLLSRASRPRKRKSSAEKLLFCTVAFSANVPCKTDGSYVNRPFFRCRQDVQETAFPPKDILSRSVFCFFSSRKGIVPFFSFYKKRSKRKSTAAELLFCASAAFANVQHKTDGSHTNRPFFRSWQNARESVFSQINQLSRSVFCFFSSRKEIVPFFSF